MDIWGTHVNLFQNNHEDNLDLMKCCLLLKKPTIMYTDRGHRTFPALLVQTSGGGVPFGFLTGTGNYHVCIRLRLD